MREEIPDIRVDIDRDRLQVIVGEAYDIIVEDIGGNFVLSKEAVLQQLNKILNTGRVTTQFFLSLGSAKEPDLELRVDPIRKEVLSKSGNRRLAAHINHLISTL